MKKLFIALTSFLLFSFPAVSNELAGSQESEAQKETAASPELAEASKLDSQAVKLHNENKHDEALPLAKRALEIREKALGRDHELVADSLYNLANIYLAKTKYQDAESFYKRALAILEKNFGSDSIRLLATLENLAWSRFARRDNGGAEKTFQRALVISEKAFGPEHPNTGRRLASFGTFYERTEKHAKAAEFYKRALEIKEKSLGSGHTEVIDLLEKCACALALNNEQDEAKQYKERAEKLRQSAPPMIRKSGGVLAGQALYRMEPAYPVEAKQARISGAVIVEVTVDECGQVVNVRSLFGPSELRRASEEAARKWRFKPTKLEGRPVRVIGTITFNFNL